MKTSKGKEDILRQVWIWLCFIVLFLLSACGIEDYQFLPSVPEGNIQMTFNTHAVIQLPSFGSEYSYFNNFAIYYKIYISGISDPSQPSVNNLGIINQTLSGDYASIRPYTQNTSTTSVSVGSVFSNRYFYKLELENANIDSVLSNSAEGQVLTLAFPSIGSTPYLSIGGSSYILYRSNGGGVFNPRPNRYFINTPELHSNANVSSTVNADTARDGTGTERYTYAAMYIVVTGMDSNFTPLFSAPTYIGIFALPNP